MRNEMQNENKKMVVYVDMDNTLVDFMSGVSKCPKEKVAKYECDENGKQQYDNIPGVFAKMEPMPGAVEAFHWLAKHFDTYILSTAPWNNPSAWSDKLEWVKTYLGDVAYKRLILSHHKDLLRGDYLIDDRPHKCGADKFIGEVIHFGSSKFPNWDAVVEYLMEKYRDTVKECLKGK